MQRRIAGIIALALLIGGAALYIWQPDWENAIPLAAACVRIGAVLGAIWLAYPELKRVPKWLATVCAAAAIAVAIRPRLAIFIIPLTLILLILRPRPKKSGSPSAKSRKQKTQTSRSTADTGKRDQ